ncbi:MAG: TIGR03086 family metal-binding protein [Nakamurella sp.]
MNDVITAINDALKTTGAVVRAIPAGRWHRPTPCHDWDVHLVTNHLVGGIRIFAAELTGIPEIADHDSDWLGFDPVAAYADAALADCGAWPRADALRGTITIGLGTMPAPLAALIHLTEILVHGVDIAVAIDRADLVDQHQCADLFTAMQRMGGVDPYRVPGVFGPQVPTAVGDLPHRRLLGYLGRELPLGTPARSVPARAS